MTTTVYQSFVEDHGFEAVVNASLVPTEDNEPKFLASVMFPGVMNGAVGVSPRFSDHIDMWVLPTHEVSDCFLTGREMEESALKRMKISYSALS